MPGKTALVPIAAGSEEIEAITVVDSLRRADVAVTVAAVGGSKLVTCARGTRVEADALIEDVADQSFDLVYLPGGLPGASNLRADATVERVVRAQNDAGQLLSAICAAPAVVLHDLGIIGERAATAYPGFSDKLANQAHVAERVVVDGHIVTSRAPGTAMELAYTLISLLVSKDKADEVGKSMLLNTLV
eukprot:CAMPEP_0114622116 /NCGR_PEP_ID=MMETSP0168-20121206/9576_1 /TAXON_ID=95228 ORGANISM="Vannella sp., Strain DIVA3 517/6/12" /NCGR_SAMPLE_ID=MMETSP0168 /ASSEMBLY_ACC=CAM_ASM_000044 /LENGTH=188 /DNA_ID=CAMNT_0001833331 /DNA_START=8 /DNA_END=574 /DNA_ORIENTATION=+